MDLKQSLERISTAGTAIPKNDDYYTYTIFGFDGSPYITRTLLPRVGGTRPLIHRIHRADYDQWLHNHPWKTATFRIVSGGYTEERLVDGHTVHRILRPGDENVLDADTYHRVVEIEPDTWTFGMVGERVQQWGFLVGGDRFVEAYEYFRQCGRTPPVGGIS